MRRPALPITTPSSPSYSTRSLSGGSSTVPPGSSSADWRLDEEERLGRNVAADLFGVGAVVLADADDLARLSGGEAAAWAGPTRGFAGGRATGQGAASASRRPGIHPGPFSTRIRIEATRSASCRLLRLRGLAAQHRVERSSSSITCVPCFLAASSLVLPTFSPATRNVVPFLTLSWTSPPAARMSACTSSRLLREHAGDAEAHAAEGRLRRRPRPPAGRARRRGREASRAARGSPGRTGTPRRSPPSWGRSPRWPRRGSRASSRLQREQRLRDRPRPRRAGAPRPVRRARCRRR